MKSQRYKVNAQLAGFYRFRPHVESLYRRRKARIDDYIGGLASLDEAMELARPNADEHDGATVGADDECRHA